MTTKRPLYKQIIVPMGNENITTFMKSSSEYMVNINCDFKSVKSNNSIDFIHLDCYGALGY